MLYDSGRPVQPIDRRAPLTWASVPGDYAEQIRALRRARGLSQAQLATLVGRSAEGRRLSMGGAQTHAVGPVLATPHHALHDSGQPVTTGSASAKPSVQP